MEEKSNENPRIEVITGSALEAMQRAEIDLQVATAHRFPRPTLSKIKQSMLDFACLDEETAESCFYSLPRDGKTIAGPSVRLAEIAVACWGNLRAASRIISNDGQMLTSQGACHDLENNTLISVEVQRRITDKKGRTFSADMIVVTGNAANSIAFRNAVFKVIPSALIKPVYDAARRVAVGDAKSLATKRVNIVKRLNAMEVTTDRVLARLNRASVEDITLEDLEVLIGAGTAIRDGDTSVDEAFPAVAKQGFAAPGAQETPEQRDARLQRQMDEQATGEPVKTAEEPKKEPVKEEPPKQEPKSEGPRLVGFWPTRELMMAAFEQLMPVMTAEEVNLHLSQNGIGSPEDMGISDQATIACYKELAKIFDEKQKAEKLAGNAPKRPVFGRKQ